MYRSSPFRSTLNTSYITGLDMCEVRTEAVHSVALWTRVTSQVWTCVKYLMYRSSPFRSTLNTSYITGFTAYPFALLPFTVLRFYFLYAFTLLLFYAFTLLLFYLLTLLRFYAFTLLPFNAFTLLRFYSCTLLPFYAFTLVPLLNQT